MELQNIEYNGIEYEIKGLIEFSSLARLLVDLAKRQKEIESKYESLNKTASDKDQRVSELELKVFGESKGLIKKKDDDSISQFSKPSSKINYDYVLRENNFEGSANPNYNNNDARSATQTFNIQGINNINNTPKEKIDSASGYRINPDVITKLYGKIKSLEKKISEINNKTNNDIIPKIHNNKDNINSANNNIEKLEKNYEEISQKFTNFNEEFDAIKVKIEDFNIYDIFKSDLGENGGLDASKALIMALENKIFKKFSLYDEKNKKNESDLFKIIEDLKNIKALIDNFKTIIQRNNDKVSDIEKNLNDYITKNDNKLEEITNNIEAFEHTNNASNVNELKKEFNEKIEKLEEDIKNNMHKGKSPAKESDFDINDESLRIKFEEYDKNLKEIRKNINELDKNLNQNISRLDNSLKEKISIVKKEIQMKANSNELIPINDKIYNLEELIRDLNIQVDTLQQYNDKFKSDFSNFNKKMEYLNGVFSEFKSKFDNGTANKKVDFDESSFISQTAFNEYKKENNAKIDKLKVITDNLSRIINETSSSLDKYSTNKDFIQFQNNLMALLEEFKINCFKKFMEKHEIHKNLRILENQIKSLSDSRKKAEAADNWLLAKKPISNFQCASCEAMLKDLDKNDTYIPWNKYPNREEKTYRMGHGFSHMLQMVNEEIIKNIENKDNKGYVSDEDRKYTKNRSKYNDSSTLYENKSIKLPKVLHKNINNDKFGLTVNKFSIAHSPYDDVDSGSQDEPKIHKIYKINNNTKKLFGFNKTNIENDNNFSPIHGERKYIKIRDNIPTDNIQMSMTQPNDKK